jgi:hypothetical protein
MHDVTTRAGRALHVIVMALGTAGCVSSSGTYPYWVTSEGVIRDSATMIDKTANVTYEFSAEYSIDVGVHTKITVAIHNGNADTLDMSLSYVKVTSKNVSYRYNDRFIPIDILFVSPGGTRTLTLVGESVRPAAGDPWLSIAGEELIVTVKGMRIGRRTLATQVVRFVPHNPKLGA